MKEKQNPTPEMCNLQCLASNKKLPGMQNTETITYNKRKYQSIETDSETEIIELVDRDVKNASYFKKGEKMSAG